MEDLRYSAYKNMLLNVAEFVDQDNSVLESMKFRCDRIIKGRERDQIKSAIQLWTALEKREYLGPLNTSFLKNILETCMRGQLEALNIVESYERLNGNATNSSTGQQRARQSNNQQILYLQGLNRQHQERKILGPDLKNEFAYLTKSLGQDWRFFMRELEIPESEIEIVTSDYRYTREQIIQCLLLWQNTQKQQATKERLIQALRAENRNDLADTLEKGNY